MDRCSDCGSLLVENMPPENPDAEPYTSLTEVFNAAGDQEALVVKGLLESEGVECSLSSDIPHSVVPVNIDGLGTVRISVSESDAERAKAEISQIYKRLTRIARIVKVKWKISTPNRLRMTVTLIRSG